MLDSEIPLINLSVAGFSHSQRIVVVITPHGQLSISVPLRRCETAREGIGQRGKLRLKLVHTEKRMEF